MECRKCKKTNLKYKSQRQELHLVKIFQNLVKKVAKMNSHRLSYEKCVMECHKCKKTNLKYKSQTQELHLEKIF